MAKIIAFFCFVQLISATSVWAQSVPGDSTINRLNRLVETGKPNQVLREVQQALAKEKNLDSLGALYVIRGKAFLSLAKPDSARLAFQEALKVGEGATPMHQLLAADVWEGLAQGALQEGKLEQALDFELRTLKTRESILGKDKLPTAHACRLVGDIFVLLGDTLNASRYILRASGIQERILDPKDAQWADLYLSLGNLALAKGNASEAMNFFEDAHTLRVAKFGARHPKVAEVLLALGQSAYRLRKWNDALKYYTSCETILVDNYGPGSAVLARVYAGMGDVLLAQFDLRKAEEVCRKALAQYPRSFKNERATLQYNIATCLDSRGMEEAALLLLDSAQTTLKSSTGAWLLVLRALYERTGSILVRQGNYARALPFFQRSISLHDTRSNASRLALARVLNQQTTCFLKLRQRSNASLTIQRVESVLSPVEASGVLERAVFLKNKAMLEAISGRYESALGLVRKSLGLLWPDRNITNVNMVLAPEILRLLVLESTYMVGAGTKPADAVGLMETALQLRSRLHLAFVEDEQYDWKAASSELFAATINMYYSAWRSTKKQTYLEQAFLWSERYKTSVLSSAAIGVRASTYRGITTRLLEAKIDAEQTLFQLEKQRWEAIQQEDSKQDSYLRGQIAQTLQELKRINANLADDDPRFAWLTGTGKIPGLSTLRKSLQPDQALISYFVSESDLFAFILSRESLKGVRIKKDFPLDILASNYMTRMRTLSAYAGLEREKQALLWTGNAQQLYQRILAPVAPFLREYNRLVISPDGVLRYISFDALLMESPAYATQFKSHVYVGRRYGLSYAHSATLLAELESRKPKGPFSGKYLLTFAPIFPKGESNFSPLEHNLKESQSIRKLLGGRQLEGQEATVESFKALASEYRVLHLPTYAHVSSTLSDTSFLAFTPSGNTPQKKYLVASDMFGMQLQSDLVVLSRMEIPVEGLHYEEGVLGWMGGFYFAGARSLASTFWQADDRRSSNLVERYFVYLRGGLPKDLALQRARQDFLNEYSNMDAHPYFWAGMTIAGNTDALPDPRLQWVVSWLIALVGLGVALTLYWRWIQKRSPKSLSSMFGKVE